MGSDQGLPDRRLRVGVVGAGVIAQVMHLHYLAELSDLYEVTAICDIVGANARACADKYGIPAAYADWRELIAAPLDAIFVLTSGSHAPIAIAAAEARLHVFTEKPMCFSVAEGKAMVAAAEEAGTTLMVGYPKRYDLAYAKFSSEVAALPDARLLRVTTMESPFRPYIAHYSLLRSTPPSDDVVASLLAASDASLNAAISPVDDLERRVYHGVLLDTLVHEINSVRGLLGEPDRLDYVDLSEDNVTVMLRYGDLRAAIHWVDLPGIARYRWSSRSTPPSAGSPLNSLRPSCATSPRASSSKAATWARRDPGAAPRWSATTADSGASSRRSTPARLPAPSQSPLAATASPTLPCASRSSPATG